MIEDLDQDALSVVMALVGAPDERLTEAELVALNPRKGEERVREVLDELESEGYVEERSSGEWVFTEHGREVWGWVWNGQPTLQEMHESAAEDLDFE
ncbi:hypothetical protein ACFO0N_07395 [Halobium salinum]|uniref:MarR family transcriptional regulator n=1 Tax=Halobium salinum TaxID=1364940 RepID=A0ABD5PBD3_9EURY|nr:hypothetical protein [Halobium salinum]